jgi:ribonuclease P protein component
LLARENRLIKADDFRSTMKLGRKLASDRLVTYVRVDEANSQVRFGFVVSKAVGGAVARNLVKRRLRAIAREAMSAKIPTNNMSIVVRALEGTAKLPFDALRTEFLNSVNAGVKKLAK